MLSGRKLHIVWIILFTQGKRKITLLGSFWNQESWVSSTFFITLPYLQIGELLSKPSNLCRSTWAARDERRLFSTERVTKILYSDNYQRKHAIKWTQLLSCFYPKESCRANIKILKGYKIWWWWCKYLQKQLLTGWRRK